MLPMQAGDSLTDVEGCQSRAHDDVIFIGEGGGRAL